MSCFIFPDRPFLPRRLPAFGSYGIKALSFRCYSPEQMPPWPVFWMMDSFSHRPLHPKTLISWLHGDGEKEIKAQRLEKWKQKVVKHCWDKWVSAYVVQGQMYPMGATLSSSLSLGMKGEEPQRQVCIVLCSVDCRSVHHHLAAVWSLRGFSTSTAKGRQRAMGHEISSSPISPVCFWDGAKIDPYFLRFQGRHTHFSACWETGILKTAK